MAFNLGPFFDLLQSIGGLEMAVMELRDVREEMVLGLIADNIEQYKLGISFLDDFITLFDKLFRKHANALS